MGQRVVKRLWAIVAADLMEVPLSNGQYKYVVVIHDILTRWIEFKSLRTADSKSVAKALESLYYSNGKLRIIC